MSSITVELPITGWWADGQAFSHKVEPPPDDLTLTSIVGPIAVRETRPFLSYAVETLANARDNGTVGQSGIMGEMRWLEWNGYVRAVEAKAEIMDRWINDVRFRITDKGREFLAVHEAPAEW